MKPYKERLHLIDAAIDKYKGKWPDDECNFISMSGSSNAAYKKGDILPTFGGDGDDKEGYWYTICTRDEFNQRAKELGYINSYKYGVEYETNGEKPDLPDDVKIQVFDQGLGWCKSKLGTVKDWFSPRKPKYYTKFRIVDDRFKPKDQDMNDCYEKFELPPVGVKLKGARVVSQDGVKDWFDFPRYEVVAHHSNGKTFFVEVLDDKGSYLGTQKFDVGCGQYKPLPTETDKLVEQMYDDASGEYDLDTATKPTNQHLLTACRLLHEKGYRKIKLMSEEEFATHSRKQLIEQFSPMQLAKLYRAGCRFLDQGE